MESLSSDEVFLDMTRYPSDLSGSGGGGPTRSKDKIRDEPGFTVNVGIGTNKLLAKMASDFEKPDKGTYAVSVRDPGKMWPLPVRDLLFLGKASGRDFTGRN